MNKILEMLKTHKKKVALCSVAAILVITSVITFVMINKKPIEEPIIEDESSSNRILNIKPINPADDKTDETLSSSTTVTAEIKKEVSSTPEAEKIPESQIAKPTTEKEPENYNTKPTPENNPNQGNNNNGGTTDENGGYVPPVYECGSPNHKCQNLSGHNYQVAREQNGCKLCGSHSCPSFYAINEWGFTTLNRKLCPKYDANSEICKACGNKWCNQKTTDGNCSGCGVFLKKDECHDCPNDLRKPK